MGRQRTIDDNNFWHSAKLLNCTTEDRVALLHLLTCPVSNVVGIYSILPRIAGAELGWTADQWLQVISRLQEVGLVRFKREQMIVWVCIWWEHHKASQVTGEKLKERTRQQLIRIPDEWRDDFCIDIKPHLSISQYGWVESVLQGKVEDTSKLSDGYGIDRVSDKSRPNTYHQQQLITKPTTQAISPSRIDMTKIPRMYQVDVHNAIMEAMEKGTLVRDPQIVIDAMTERFASTTSPVKHPHALTMDLATRGQLNS